MGDTMSFNINHGGKPAEVAEKLRNKSAWYRAETCQGGAEAADFLAAIADKVTADDTLLAVEAQGHVDGNAAGVTLTVKTYK